MGTELLCIQEQMNKIICQMYANEFGGGGLHFKVVSTRTSFLEQEILIFLRTSNFGLVKRLINEKIIRPMQISEYSCEENFKLLSEKEKEFIKSIKKEPFLSEIKESRIKVLKKITSINVCERQAIYREDGDYRSNTHYNIKIDGIEMECFENLLKEIEGEI